MAIPEHPKIYHIVHINRLQSIIADDYLLSDARMAARPAIGTNIGINKIKQRRLNELRLASYHDLFVGQCVPFNFCPRSVMLYMLYQRNHPELTYRDGQEPILYLVADLYETIKWANEHSKRWVFTLSNAGSRYFEDKNDLKYLVNIDWQAVQANVWPNCKEKKQAEFLLENEFPWNLVERVGVFSESYLEQVLLAMQNAIHRPRVEICKEWYY